MCAGKDSHGWAVYLDYKRSWFIHRSEHLTRCEGGIVPTPTPTAPASLEAHADPKSQAAQTPRMSKSGSNGSLKRAAGAPAASGPGDGHSATTRVGVLLDLSAEGRRSLAFYLNGAPHGPRVFLELPNDTFYPAVSLNRNVTVTLCSGLRAPPVELEARRDALFPPFVPAQQPQPPPPATQTVPLMAQLSTAPLAQHTFSGRERAAADGQLASHHPPAPPLRSRERSIDRISDRFLVSLDADDTDVPLDESSLSRRLQLATTINQQTEV